MPNPQHTHNMATRKAVRKTDSFTPDQLEEIIRIASDVDVEYDTEEIAKDIAKDKALSEIVGFGAIPHITSNPQFVDVVRDQSEKIAAHVADVVSNSLLGRELGELRSKVEAAIQSAAPAARTSKARKIAAAIGGAAATADALTSWLLKYGAPSNALCPMLLLGEQGAGKTYSCRSLSSQYEVYVEVPCHSGMEARDFLGGFLPNGKSSGSLAWVDMGVTRAFRAAASGKSVLLLVDEIFRVPQRERSVFLTALSPLVKPDGTEVYVLNIDRPIDGDKNSPHITETIEAPVHLLTIVATTNIGSQFSVTDDDPAMAERWVHRYVYCDEASIHRILSNKLDQFGIATTFATNFVEFWKAMTAMKKEGTISLAPTVRTLSRAIDCSGVDSKTAADDIKTSFVASIMDIAPMWAGTDLDGRLNEEQLKGIEKIAMQSFGVIA